MKPHDRVLPRPPIHECVIGKGWVERYADAISAEERAARSLERAGEGGLGDFSATDVFTSDPSFQSFQRSAHARLPAGESSLGGSDGAKPCVR
jgi:hypothetical protein